MKGVMQWIKGHLVVVVCSALIVISLPTALFVSSGWGESVREEQARIVEEEASRVQNLEVTYRVPPARPDGEPIERRFVPNEAYIERFRQLLDAQQREQREVVAAALAFNRHTPVLMPGDDGSGDGGGGGSEEGSAPSQPVGLAPEREQSEQERRLEDELLGDRVGVPPHEVIIPGLLPAPSGATRGEELTLDFVREFAGLGRSDGMTLYERLLREGDPDSGEPGAAIAGLPPEPAQVARVLERTRQQFLDRLPGDAGGSDGEANLEQSQRTELRELLRDRRLARYSARAGELSFYIDPSMLRGINSQSPVPDSLDEVPLWQVFEFHWDYWMLKDLLAAIESANTNERGRRLDIEDAPVKRVENISVSPLLISRAEDGSSPSSGDRGIAANRPSLPERGGLIGTGETWSLTGRLTHPGNDLYDVRTATLELIVDQREIPRVLEAFPRTNLMTVLDMDIQSVDAWSHLREGYYYGEAPVVRLTLEVETLWLREWTVPMMPERVRRDLGVEDSGGRG